MLQKNKSKGNVESNYRPMTCLPLMWKLLTGVIADQIYAHLDQENIIISLSCHEQVCLSGLRFERYFSHHRAR